MYMMSCLRGVYIYRIVLRCARLVATNLIKFAVNFRASASGVGKFVFDLIGAHTAIANSIQSPGALFGACMSFVTV